MRNALRIVLASGLAAGIAAVPDAWAQPAAQPGPAPATTTPAPAVTTTPGTITTHTTTTNGTTATNDTRTDDATKIVDAAMLESGANSFTQGQAQSRMERAGLTGVQDLHKDDQGFWRGRAMQNGQSVEVALDFRGRIAAGTSLAALGTGTNAGHSASTTPSSTSANPPGTAASRSIDRATGSNLSGTNPPPAPTR